MSPIDTVIFDLGNVLITVDELRAADRLAGRTGKTREQISAYALSTPYATNLALGKLTRQQFFEIVARDLAFEGTYDEFAFIWADIFAPIEPMIALAGSLKNRVQRLLLSNTNAIHMDYVFTQYPFLREFDALLLSYEVGCLKPDAAIYNHAIEKNALTPSRCVFIDDLETNVEGARRVGLQAIQFRDVEQLRAELTKLGLSPI